MDTAFWLGLLFSIPVGVAVNLATPRLQRWLAGRNAKSMRARERRREELLSHARDLRSNPFSFALFAERGGTGLISQATLLIVFVNLPFYFATAVQFVDYRFSAIMYTLINTIGLLFVLVLLTSFMNARRRHIEILRLAEQIESDSRSSDSAHRMEKEGTESVETETPPAVGSPNGGTHAA